MLRSVFPVALVGLIACASSSSSSPSPPIEEDAGITDAGSGEQDAALPPPVAFTPEQLQGVFDVKCIRCHTQIDVLDLRNYPPATIGVAPESSDTRAKCKDSAAKMIIAPGNREGSLLWRKVNGTQDCGDPMPLPFRGIKMTPREIESLGLYIDSL